MTMLDDDVLDVETARPAARSAANTKAAIAYLIASDATAISIVENVTGCTFRVGTKIDPRAAVVHWGSCLEARPVHGLVGGDRRASRIQPGVQAAADGSDAAQRRLHELQGRRAAAAAGFDPAADERRQTAGGRAISIRGNLRSLTIGCKSLPNIPPEIDRPRVLFWTPLASFRLTRSLLRPDPADR